jgi:hypothetical protein
MYDHRELWEIPEVIRWYEKADSVFCNWFFFLSTRLPAPGLKTYFACLCNAKREEPKNGVPGKIMVSFDPDKVSKLFRTNFLRLNELTERLGMSTEENKKISYAAFDVMQVPHGD